MATVEQAIPPLVPGERLTQEEFLRRWEAMPQLKFAELIGGVVHMPSPLSLEHRDVDVAVAGWLAVYAASTPGCRPSANATWLMLDDVPQPDTCLRILAEYGGRYRVEGRYPRGVPELIVEVSMSRASYDLGEKLIRYQTAGVPEYVVVLPEDEEVRWHRLDGDVYQPLTAGPDGVFRSVVFPGLWLDAAALFRDDMGQVLAVLGQGTGSPEHAEFVRQLAVGRAT